MTRTVAVVAVNDTTLRLVGAADGRAGGVKANSGWLKPRNPLLVLRVTYRLTHVSHTTTHVTHTAEEPPLQRHSSSTLTQNTKLKPSSRPQIAIDMTLVALTVRNVAWPPRT